VLAHVSTATTRVGVPLLLFKFFKPFTICQCLLGITQHSVDKSGGVLVALAAACIIGGLCLARGHKAVHGADEIAEGGGWHRLTGQCLAGGGRGSVLNALVGAAATKVPWAM